MTRGSRANRGRPRPASRTRLRTHPRSRSFILPSRSIAVRSRRLGGGITAVGVLLLKFKFLFTFAIAIGAYALFWGWWFGVGIALLLLVHEMGHVIWLRREGISATLPVFIPFMGAFVAMKEMPRNAYVEAKVGLAGPVLGSAGALAVLVWGNEVNSNLLRALAYFGFLLNLFNLIPVVPLDGGRAVSALHPAFWFAGLFAVALLFYKYESPILLLVLAFCCYELYNRWNRRDLPGYREYHSVTIPQRRRRWDRVPGAGRAARDRHARRLRAAALVGPTAISGRAESPRRAAGRPPRTGRRARAAAPRPACDRGGWRRRRGSRRPWSSSPS